MNEYLHGPAVLLSNSVRDDDVTPPQPHFKPLPWVRNAQTAPGGAERDEEKKMARNVANRAKELRKTNPRLTFNQAWTRARAEVLGPADA